MSFTVAFLSLAIESLTGYPVRLLRMIGHPVTWIGHLIDWLDRGLNRAAHTDLARRVLGIAALAVIVGLPAAVGWALQTAFASLAVWGLLLTALVATALIAQRSLASHVRAVADALDAGGLPEGRKAVSMIVGRDPESLDEAAVCRAAIESLAENFSDGVVAPASWLALGGLPAAAAYKAANTADSMIGHRTPRHEAFGWAAARFDDLVNLPASRLTALLTVAAAFVLPGCDGRAAWKAVWRDARRHRSPNAGWPEAAFAGALGLALAGPRSYGGVAVNDVFMGDGRREATSADIRNALRLYWTADLMLIALLGAISLVVSLN